MSVDQSPLAGSGDKHRLSWPRVRAILMCAADPIPAGIGSSRGNGDLSRACGTETVKHRLGRLIDGVIPMRGTGPYRFTTIAARDRSIPACGARSAKPATAKEFSVLSPHAREAGANRVPTRALVVRGIPLSGSELVSGAAAGTSVPADADRLTTMRAGSPRPELSPCGHAGRAIPMYATGTGAGLMRGGLWGGFS